MTALALVGIAAVGFGVQAQAASYQQVYAFQGGSDGAGPDAPLINVDGTLYGTTAGISSSSSSTIFSLDPTTGAETVLHDFPAAPTYSAGLVEVGRKLYGVHNDTVISLNLDTRQEKVIFNFASPGNSIGDFPRPCGRNP